MPMLRSQPCSDQSPLTQERGNRMRRKRYQRGSVNPRKRRGKNYWYAQWREDGKPKSKELGSVSAMTRAEAESILPRFYGRSMRPPGRTKERF